MSQEITRLPDLQNPVPTFEELFDLGKVMPNQTVMRRGRSLMMDGTIVEVIFFFALDDGGIMDFFRTRLLFKTPDGKWETDKGIDIPHLPEDLKEAIWAEIGEVV